MIDVDGWALVRILTRTQCQAEQKQHKRQGQCGCKDLEYVHGIRSQAGSALVREMRGRGSVVRPVSEARVSVERRFVGARIRLCSEPARSQAGEHDSDGKTCDDFLSESGAHGINRRTGLILVQKKGDDLLQVLFRVAVDHLSSIRPGVQVPLASVRP